MDQKPVFIILQTNDSDDFDDIFVKSRSYGSSLVKKNCKSIKKGLSRSSFQIVWIKTWKWVFSDCYKTEYYYLQNTFFTIVPKCFLKYSIG